MWFYTGSFPPFVLDLAWTWACLVSQKCRFAYGFDAKDMETRLTVLDGAPDPAGGEESWWVASPTVSRKEEPNERPELNELVNSSTRLPEVGAPAEPVPREPPR